jgi:uncharacterized protein
MDKQQVQYLIDHYEGPGHEPEKVHLFETHISWVIVGSEYAYKIKKPVSYSFVDFKTLEKRKFFCEEELKLNKRLAPGMYIAVVAIRNHNGRLMLDHNEGEIIDYAVKMHKMHNANRMDLMLNHKKVTKRHIKKIAESVNRFHNSIEIVKKPLDFEEMKDTFNDIQSVSGFIKKEVGYMPYNIISRSIDFSNHFLETHEDLFNERMESGYVRNCHGDLHSGNIFIVKDEPVIFDCIEFNESLRHIDILNEIAFFCVNMEKYDRKDLSTLFLDYYLTNNPILRDKEDGKLFLFYKLYRANVKTKINALKAMVGHDTKERERRIKLIRKYAHIMSDYLAI